MLLYPSVNTLNDKTDSRYSLVMLAAKRARDLVDGKRAITDDLISYSRPEGLE